ncbi:hypothetical protein WOC21_19130 [Vibrio parahaemolyticus]
MNKLIDILNKVGQRKDIMLAVMLLAIVFMMILPALLRLGELDIWVKS